MFLSLPKDITKLIIALLEFVDLGNAAQVSKGWNSLLYDCWTILKATKHQPYLSKDNFAAAIRTKRNFSSLNLEFPPLEWKSTLDCIRQIAPNVVRLTVQLQLI